MKNSYFITGTDTGVGKTLIAGALMQLLRQRGRSVAGFKPIATGCRRSRVGLRNDDALQLQQLASVELAYDTVNPYAFEPAIAPHIAAQQRGTVIDLEIIAHRFNDIAMRVDCVVVEGAGGWRVPVNATQGMAELALRLGLPVILVVGIRLGCLNHALLSVESILGCGARLAGWVANHIEADTLNDLENIETLRKHIHSPLLGIVPFNSALVPAQAALYLQHEA